MAQIIVGLEQLNVKLDKLKTANAEKAMKEACMLVERDAKLFCPPNGGRYPRAPFNGDPENTTPYSSTGDLRNSIMSEWNEKEGRIGTNLEYAPYVHQGTGIYAVNGDGRQDVPWRYQDAEGNWHSTSGQMPQPFLADAFELNRGKIAEIFKEALKEAAK